jgi:hypothetical protein
MRFAIVLFALVTTLGLRAAHADGIVLESYTGDRPADAPRLLAPVLEELAQRKFTAGDGVARLFDTRVSRAALQPAGVPTDFAAQADKGFKAWVAGRLDEAITTLGQLVTTAHGSSGAFASDPSLREPLQKALIALALAQQRNGDQAAMRSTFGELVRSFPDAVVPRAAYGPDAQLAFEGVKRELLGGGRGKLTVKLTDDSAVVFVNEAYRAVGSTTVELIPGEYRVVVMANKQPSRAHAVTITAGGTATIEIDPKWDLMIRTNGYTGLSFPTQAERDAAEATSAARFARAVGASAVAVVGIDDVRGHSAVVGSLVSLESGREIRRASIPIEPDPSTERLRALARFLSGDDPVAGLDVQFSNPYDRDIGNKRTREAPDGPRWGGWRWITGGIGIAGLATGGVLLGLDGRCPSHPPVGQPCNDVYATATPGFIALGAGAVFAGVSIYLFVTHESSPPATVPVVAPTAGGATVGLSSRW